MRVSAIVDVGAIPPLRPARHGHAATADKWDGAPSGKPLPKGAGGPRAAASAGRRSKPVRAIHRAASAGHGTAQEVA